MPEIQKKPTRKYLPENIKVSNWNVLEPFFKELLERPINSKEDLEKWMHDMSELEAMLDEDFNWRQIKMTCDTNNKDLEESFNFFCTEIHPHIQPYAFEINKKLAASPFAKELDQQKYFTYLRSIKNSIELFQEKNIELKSQLAMLQQQYGVITGRMSIEVNGKEYTLQQAGKFYENPDRELRKEVYYKDNERRLQDKEQLDNLFTELVTKRNQVALNAGFKNYRDYKFRELGRFDYTEKDCFDFHNSIRDYTIPLINEIYKKKQERLQLDSLRPWDTAAEPSGIKPLRPFDTSKELIDKTIECLDRVDPYFGECIREMNEKKLLDLESRNGKAPGGYSSTLMESGSSFIFMNAAGQMHDVTTMVHEAGHAIQSALTSKLDLSAFKDYPMEIAEVASMTMELFSMDHWDIFFNDEEELRRAKEKQLEGIILIFPWIAVIDKFQHWIYENSQHTVDERTKAWISILSELSNDVIDYSGLEKFRENGWQKQLHLFEVPFYYIEYGIAQLGALGLYKQYKEDPKKAIKNYISALSLGSTKTLPELYKAAGLRFDFSADYVKSLMDFLSGELQKLKK